MKKALDLEAEMMCSVLSLQETNILSKMVPAFGIILRIGGASWHPRFVGSMLTPLPSDKYRWPRK